MYNHLPFPTQRGGAVTSTCTSRMIGECEAMSTIFSLSLKEDNCVQACSFSSFLAWPHLCSLQRGEAMTAFSFFLVWPLVFPFLDLGKGEGGEIGAMAIS